MSDNSDSRNVKFLTILERIAVDVIPIKSSRIAAAIVVGGDIISFGINSKKTHPFQARFARHEDAIYWHAECHAIYNSINRLKGDPLNLLKRATLYITRVKYSDQSKLRRFIWADCRPCSGCLKAIEEYGLTKVFFTTGSYSYDHLYSHSYDHLYSNT